MKQQLKKQTWLVFLVKLARGLKNKNGFFTKIRNMSYFLFDYNRYNKINNNSNFSVNREDIRPCIYDKTETTTIDYIYFYQDAWCAKKIFENKPSHHFDIASKVDLVGIISQFTPTTMIDIRPVDVHLKNLSFIKGDITNLPIKNNSVASLSSICVIEHIGLGRYGDALDPFGTENAVKELTRVMEHDGNLYISLPIDSRNKIYFNAHRAFTPEYVYRLFKNFVIAEEKYIYGDRIYDTYDISKGFGTGLYHFKKI